MKTGWLIGLLMLFIGLQIIMGICEMNYETQIPSVFSAFLTGGSWDAGRVHDALIGMWKAFIFDYPFFMGSWIMLRYVFMCVSGGVVIVMFWTAPLATLIGGGLLGLGTIISGFLGG